MRRILFLNDSSNALMDYLKILLISTNLISNFLNKFKEFSIYFEIELMILMLISKYTFINHDFVDKHLVASLNFKSLIFID